MTQGEEIKIRTRGSEYKGKFLGNTDGVLYITQEFKELGEDKKFHNRIKTIAVPWANIEYVEQIR